MITMSDLLIFDKLKLNEIDKLASNVSILKYKDKYI